MSEAWLSILEPDGSRQHVRLTLALTTIGRSEQNVVELLDPKLSRFHCELERCREGHTVRDCQSRNGTLVNGEPVLGRRLLADGDRVKIGRTTLVYHRGRPPELRSDPAVLLGDRAADRGGPTPPAGTRRPTAELTDRRRTQAVEAPALAASKPARFLAEQALALFDARRRSGLIEEALEAAREFVQARGALLVSGTDPDSATVTASSGLGPEEEERCELLAQRALVARRVLFDERWAAAFPLRGAGERLAGALVLADLGGALVEGSEVAETLQAFADLVARALTGSLRLEELRREERAAGARRIAHDLRALLRPQREPEVPGIDVGLARAEGEEGGSDVFDWIVGPRRAERTEHYFALGAVPDPASGPRPGLRRSGERGLLSLLGHAELRGALRALVPVLPRTADLLAELDQVLGGEGCAGSAALTLVRYDPTRGHLRFACAGTPAPLWRRAGGEAVPAAPAGGAALGGHGRSAYAERELPWEPGDVVLFATPGASEECQEALRVRLARWNAEAAGSLDVFAERLRRSALRRDPQAAESLSLLLLRRQP
ncbi:MAG: FHA domain-containing protein [Planctomycetota bacterium]|nr:MAG: FHA domain-containing protein [Planctomycetota bacterium]